MSSQQFVSVFVHNLLPPTLLGLLIIPRHIGRIYRVSFPAKQYIDDLLLLQWLLGSGEETASLHFSRVNIVLVFISHWQLRLLFCLGSCPSICRPVPHYQEIYNSWHELVERRQKLCESVLCFVIKIVQIIIYCYSKERIRKARQLMLWKSCVWISNNNPMGETKDKDREMSVVIV